MTLIEQIQRDCIDPNVPVSILLLKVKLAASKLKVRNLSSWVHDELAGYYGRSAESIPNYRYAVGTPMYASSMIGWRPLGGAVDSLRTLPCNDPIAKLESLAANDPSQGSMRIAFSEQIRKRIVESWDGDDENCMALALFVDKSVVDNILASVRRLVLDWACALEESGVKGNGSFSFTPQEQREADKVTNTIINNSGVMTVGGHVGSENKSSAIENSVDFTAASALVASVRSNLANIAPDPTVQLQVNELVKRLETELLQPAPKRTNVEALLTDLRSVLTNATGTLAATGVLHLIGKLLAS